jgi:hypothetical protein
MKMAKRSISKPGKSPAEKTSKAKTKPTEVATASKPRAGITHVLAKVQAAAANFGGLTDRDGAYHTFYKSLAGANGGRLTVQQIVDSGRKPNYEGSAKAHDAGVLQRLIKAKLWTGAGTTDNPFRMTTEGASHK